MKRLSPGSAAIVVRLGLLLAGCEEDVVAVLGTERAYTLWGVLNPLTDMQFVRVFPIEGTLNPGEPEALDARLLSVDLDTGAERTWRDSISIDDRGIVGHVFYAPFRAEYGHTYRLEITGEDGRSSLVEVEVPLRTNLTLGEPDTSQGVLLPGYILNNPPHLVRSELVVRIGYIIGFSAAGCPTYDFARYVIVYDDRVRRTQDGWWFIVNLSDVYSFVETLTQEDPLYLRRYGITLANIRFDTIVANDAWAPPDGSFDPDVLVEPGAMNNVENGFGFVGAGYPLTRTWTLLARVVEQSGFRADYVSC